MKKNTYFLLFFILLSTLLLSGCWGGKKIDSTTKTTTEPIITDEYSGALINSDSDYEDASGSITENKIQENISDIAVIRSGDIKNCKLLTGSGKDTCADTIMTNTATDTLDYNGCNAIINEAIKKECITTISQSLLKVAINLSDCLNIPDTSIQATCKIRFSAVSDSVNGLASCATILNRKIARQCADEYYLVQVRKGYLKDIALCDKIGDALGKRECSMRLSKESAIVAKDNSIGEIAKVTCTGNDYCMKEKIVNEGVKNGDITSCKAISNAIMQKSCVDEITSNIANTLFKEALSKKDSTLCDKITNPNAAKQCKEIIAR